MPQPVAFITNFTQARDNLTDLMTAAVRHRPVVIDRHQGKESALLVGTEDVRSWLEPLAEETLMPLEVVEEDDEVIVTATRLSLMGAGATVHAALEELADEIDDYAEVFFADYDFYRRTDQGALAPWLLRFRLSEPDEQAGILLRPLAEGRMREI
jgi:PHD/YefM family antitoxin component YafN of YafNO toxin-antitoxin module